MELCIVRCVFYTTKVMQLCTIFFIIVNALHISGGISAHHQELIKLYVQPWVLSCFPVVYRCCRWEICTIFFITVNALHVFGRSFRASSGAHKTEYAVLGIVMLSCCLPLLWMGWGGTGRTVPPQPHQR